MNTDNANKFLDERQIYQRDVWDSKDIEHPLDCLLEDYHQEQLKLLGITDVSDSLPSDDRIVAEAIQAARKVNTEVGLLPNNNDIRMFCLGAKWMRDFAHSNDR